MRRVRIVDYRGEWPVLFEEERLRLMRVFEGVETRIEHMGSTAVPGLAAKPILDICVGVARLEDVEARQEALEGLGYEYVAEYEDLLPDRRYFRRPRRHPRTHHLHCFRVGGPEWTRHLRFRDRLRGDPDLMAAYGALKRDLAERFGSDREGYTEAKSSFIEAALSSDV